MADLDLDELERVLEVANASYADLHRKAANAILDAAPALIAAARAAQHRGDTLERVAEAVGYPRDAHYGDVLGRIDELVAERDRLRALCREAAEMLARVQVRDLEEWAPDEPTEHWSEDLEQRLRAAGGGT